METGAPANLSTTSWRSTLPAPLSAALVAVLVPLLAVFPALPNGGEMLDVKAGYTYPEVVAAMEGYGEQGRRVYAWSSAVLDTLLPVVYVILPAS